MLNASKPSNFAQHLESSGLSQEILVSALNLVDGDVAYVSGSVVDGLGDKNSDLDIFVLTSNENFEFQKKRFDSERRSQQHRLEFGIAYIKAGDIELDVEYHPISKFERLFAELEALQPINRDSMWKTFRSLGDFDHAYALEILHRFRVSFPIGNIEAYSRLRERFNEHAFLQWASLFCLMECEDYEKGVRRSLREGDADSAYLKLCRFYESLVDASLFMAGDSIDRWKWRLPKLRRLGDESLLDGFLRVELCKLSGSGLEEFVALWLNFGVQRQRSFLKKLEVQGKED